MQEISEKNSIEISSRPSFEFDFSVWRLETVDKNWRQNFKVFLFYHAEVDLERIALRTKIHSPTNFKPQGPVHAFFRTGFHSKIQKKVGGITASYDHPTTPKKPN